MKIRITGQKEQKTSKWSGGTTTELAIFPEESDYAERRFTFLISTAYCREPFSVFTELPDTERLLMPIEGAVTLRHGDGPAIRLSEGESDRFAGGDYTVSSGICRDFNLMLKGGAQGEIRYLTVPAGGTLELHLRGRFTGLYAVSGAGTVAGEHAYSLPAAGFCLIERTKEEETGTVLLKAREDSDFVLAEAEVTLPEETTG